MIGPRNVSFDRMSGVLKGRRTSVLTNKEHLRETLEVLKTFRYQGQEKKPWLDEDGKLIWSTTRHARFHRVPGPEKYVLERVYEIVSNIAITYHLCFGDAALLHFTSKSAVSGSECLL